MKRTIVAGIELCSAVLGFPLAVASGRLEPAAPSSARAASATTNVGMYGTILDPQDLAFTPKSVAVAVGDTVSWTNHSIVPHTATENHRLWDLGGNYGATPANPPGVAPQGTVQRVFEAGTFQYYCRVHPKQMHGTVSVPVTLSVSHRKVGRGRHRRTVYTVHVVWDLSSPPVGEVFDVQKGTGALTSWLTGTKSGSANFSTTRRRTVWHVQARLRKVSDSSLASGWSPDASIAAS